MLPPPELLTDDRSDSQAFVLLVAKIPANDNTPEDSDVPFPEDLPAVTLLSVY